MTDAPSTTVKIGTWLPCFPGFYNTIFDPDFDQEIYYLTKESGELPEDTDAGDLLYGWDNASYERAVVEAICKSLINRRNRYLPDDCGIIGCRLERVVNPKEYNFTNDSANVEFEIDMALFAPWLRKYLLDHEVEWAKHLRSRYTSRDGFMSYYSNNPEHWHHCIEAMLNGIELDDGGVYHRRVVEPDHLLGRLLEFILETERAKKSDEPVYIAYYYDVSDYVYVGEFIDLEKVKQHLEE
jgi:hypothetical protein